MPAAAQHQQLLGHAHLVEAVRELPWRRCAGRCICRDRRSCRRCRAASRASSTSAWPNGAGAGPLPLAGERGDHRRGGQARLAGLCPLRFSRRLAAPGSLGSAHAVLPAPSAASAGCHSSGSTRMKCALLARLEERHALGHLRVADDDARLRLRERRARRRRRATSAAMSLPSTRCTCQPNASHFGGQRLEVQDAGGRPVRLHPVDVHDADQIVELPVPGRHRRLPGRALVHSPSDIRL